MASKSWGAPVAFSAGFLEQAVQAPGQHFHDVVPLAFDDFVEDDRLGAAFVHQYRESRRLAAAGRCLTRQYPRHFPKTVRNQQGIVLFPLQVATDRERRATGPVRRRTADHGQDIRYRKHCKDRADAETGPAEHCHDPVKAFQAPGGGGERQQIGDGAGRRDHPAAPALARGCRNAGRMRGQLGNRAEWQKAPAEVSERDSFQNRGGGESGRIAGNREQRERMAQAVYNQGQGVGEPQRGQHEFQKNSRLRARSRNDASCHGINPRVGCKGLRHPFAKARAGTPGCVGMPDRSGSIRPARSADCFFVSVDSIRAGLR
jgi:hypothetical protein